MKLLAKEVRLHFCPATVTCRHPCGEFPPAPATQNEKVAARQWTTRAGRMLLLAGLFGLAAAVAGVLASTLRPGLATGPLVVLTAAAICVVSFVAAPERGWLWRRSTLRGGEESP